MTLAKLLKMAMRPSEGLPLARTALTFWDAKYVEPTWLTEVGRRLLGELLLEDGRVDEAMRTLSDAEARSKRIDSYASNTFFADLLQTQASALRVRAHGGDDDKALELLSRARAIYDEALGSGNTASLRCDVQIAWLHARKPRPEVATEKRFLDAVQAYERTLPAGHLARPEIEWMLAELGASDGASDTLRSQAPAHERAARQAWQATLGSELVTPLNVLH
jgi:hypothetical protein